MSLIVCSVSTQTSWTQTLPSANPRVPLQATTNTQIPELVLPVTQPVSPALALDLLPALLAIPNSTALDQVSVALVILSVPLALANSSTIASPVPLDSLSTSQVQ